MMLVAKRGLWHVLFVAVVAGASGCSGGATAGGSPVPAHSNTPTVPTATPATPTPMPSPSTPPDAAGHTNALPAMPPAGQSRAGQYYNIYITAPTGDTVAFTVFEPATLTGGKTYPLILQGHGWGGSRQTSPNTTDALGNMGNISQFIANGYGVISLDERGWGETTGQIRGMDPDFEGKDDLAIMDWAQNKLPWLAFGPTVDGSDPHEPIMGSDGGSYGGMFQLMLAEIDPRHRLHAIVPQFAPHDLNYSLFPYGGAKNLWGAILFGTAQGNASGPLTAPRANEDPAVSQNQEDGFATGTETQADHDFNEYHSTSYWCDNETIASNGAGLVPELKSHPVPKVNALFWQGMRDTLFDFNEALENSQCYARSGGDVRLMTYQFGHNSAGVVPDPGATYQPAGNANDMRCGKLDVDTATLAFYNQYLKMIPNAAAAVPTSPCISLSAGDAIVVPSVMTGHAGTQVAVPSTTLVAGANKDQATVVDLGITAGASGTVIAGIPRLEVDLEPVGGVAATSVPVIYAGIGQMRASNSGTWDLVDNNLTPLRGVGVHDLDLDGVSQRLAAGDKLALLLYGDYDQYDAPPGNASAASPYVLPVTVAGNVWVPLLGPLPANI
jgi:ABC-2 type transport system ATP-binding protein